MPLTTLNKLRRSLAITMATVAVAALSAACRVDIHNEEMADACGPTDVGVNFSADVLRLDPVPNEYFNVYSQGPELEIVIDAKSPDPEYGGILYLDFDGNAIPDGTPRTAVGPHLEPLVLRRFAPYGAQACWPAGRPVGFLMRAFLVNPGPNPLDNLVWMERQFKAYDKLTCEIEDAENLHSEGFPFLDEDQTRVELTDMLPGHLSDRIPQIGVQCQYIYIPGGYRGDPIAPWADLPKRP